MIGIKTWIYKGEILDTNKRRGLLPEPEPRREMRDRRDRGPRGRERGDRPFNPAPTVAAAPFLFASPRPFSGRDAPNPRLDFLPSNTRGACEP